MVCSAHIILHKLKSHSLSFSIKVEEEREKKKFSFDEERNREESGHSGLKILRADFDFFWLLHSWLLQGQLE